jgi:hypothetical protein
VVGAGASVFTGACVSTGAAVFAGSCVATGAVVAGAHAPRIRLLIISKEINDNEIFFIFFSYFYSETLSCQVSGLLTDGIWIVSSFPVTSFGLLWISYPDMLILGKAQSC